MTTYVRSRVSSGGRTPPRGKRHKSTAKVQTYGIRNTEVVGSDANKSAILLVQFEKLKVAVKIRVAENGVEFADAGEKWSRDLVQWVKKETVGQYRTEDAGKKDAGEGQRRRGSAFDRGVVILDSCNHNCRHGQKEGLEIAKWVDVELITLVPQEMGSNTSRKGGCWKEDRHGGWTA